MEVLNKALYAAMTGDTGTGKLGTLSNGGIFQLVAPETAVMNYTVFQRILRASEYSFGNATTAGHFFYQIKHYAVNGANNTAINGPAAAGAMADRAAVLLTNPTLSVTGQTVVSCRFDRSIPDGTEWDDAGKRWIYSKGGIFEVWLA